MIIDTTNYGTGNMTITQVCSSKNVVLFAREYKGWTQKQLAQKMGVSQAYIAMLENRSTPPNWKFLIKLAKVSGGFLEAPKWGFNSLAD